MKRIIFPLVTLFFLAACSQQKTPMTKGALTLSTSTPQQGATIKVQYQPDSNILSRSQKVTPTLYYAVKKNIYAGSIQLSDSGNVLNGNFTLPDSAQAFALKFTSGDHTDINNGQGYIFPVYKKSGEPLAGALAAEGRFYMSIGPSLLGIKQHPDTALTLLQKDISKHPEIKGNWQSTYLTTLLLVKKDSVYPEVKEKVQAMLSGDSVTERQYMGTYNLYSRMKMTSKSDSLKQPILQKYPKGILAQETAFQTFRSFMGQHQTDSMIALYKKYKQTFSTENPKSTAARIQGSMIVQIANLYSAKGQYEKALNYISESNNGSMQANLYNNIAWDLAQKGENLSLADSISKLSLDILQQQIDHPEKSKPTYYTAEKWVKQLKGTYGNDADTYAMILAKEGNYKKAVQYQKKAVDFTDRNTPEINARYAQYLIKTEDYTTAQKEIEKAFKNGQNMPEMQNELKTAYVKLKGSDSGYQNYLSGLEAKAEAKVKAKLTKKMIDKPASDFDLSDLKGTKISLASLKGKVVIVDFWATWCGPCKASFPGMQKALTKFKNDSNVVFLFVNTWEHTKPDVRHKQVSDFIQKHQYTFHVLLDQPQQKDSTQYQVVSAFGVNGIPTKFIIDPSGHVRFKLVGFEGNSDQEAKEVSMMINMLKG